MSDKKQKGFHPKVTVTDKNGNIFFSYIGEINIQMKNNYTFTISGKQEKKK